MKRCLLYWKNFWGNTYCIFWGILFILGDFCLLGLLLDGTFPVLSWSIFLIGCFAAYFNFAAAFMDTES